MNHASAGFLIPNLLSFLINSHDASIETSVVSLCLVDNGTSLVLGGSCDAASRQLSGEDVAYVLPIIIWQFSANFRTGLIYVCICMMYIFLSYWFLLFFLSSPQQEACNRQ